LPRRERGQLKCKKRVKIGFTRKEKGKVTSIIKLILKGGKGTVCIDLLDPSNQATATANIRNCRGEEAGPETKAKKKRQKRGTKGHWASNAKSSLVNGDKTLKRENTEKRSPWRGNMKPV